MTWSILARDAQGNFGVAIASRFFAVGALCVHTQRGVGALATQALMNPLYGARGLQLLAAGQPAAEVVRALTGADEGREHRQLHVLPAAGPAAAHTGASCIDWCGHRQFADFSVAGNMLAGPQVLEATAEAFVAARGPLAERLLAAMAAGEAAGGDKRGKQAAALLVFTTEDYCALDIRVDDHAEPLQELRRLYDKSLERYQPFSTFLPSRRSPAGVTDRALIEAGITRFHAERSGAAE